MLLLSLCRHVGVLPAIVVAMHAATPAPPPVPPIPGAGPAPLAAVFSLAPAWESAVDDTPAPFVTGTGRGVVSVSRAGRVISWAIDTGAQLWQVELGSSVASEPVAAGGGLAVVVTTESGTQTVVLDLATGGIVSRLAGGASAPIVSAVEDGFVLADASMGAASLTLIDASNGSVRWKAPLASAPSAPAGRCGDLIVVGGADGTLTAVAAADGSPRWSERIGGAISTAPLCSGRRAWVGSTDNHVHALTLRRRGAHRRWSFLTGGDVAGGMNLHGERLLFSSFDTYLYALEAGNGHLAWKVHLGRRPQSRSLLLGDLLFVAPLNTERLEVFHLPEGTQTAALALPAGKDRFVTPPSSAASGIMTIGAARYGEEASRVIAIDSASIPEQPTTAKAR